jgi:urease accessory protein
MTTATTMITVPGGTAMGDGAALLRLLTWFSPAFPTGGFAYSSGLECAVREGAVADRAALHDWIAAQMEHGSAWNDAVLMAQAMHARDDPAGIADLSALALALSGPAERREETEAQGAAFLAAARHFLPAEGSASPNAAPLPAAAGIVCGMLGIAPADAIAAFLQSFLTNQLQAAIRLGVIGQDAAAAMSAQFHPLLLEISARAAASTLDDLGGFAFAAEIAAMRHEHLQTRLFRS